MKRVVIVGAGFAGLHCARDLGGSSRFEVTVVDRRNHFVFQPLLYQVAMAELSPADIAVPIRSVLSRQRNVGVLQGEAQGFDLGAHLVRCDFGDLPYDQLVVATGAQHAYFGHEEWEQHAPGLKTLEQATEIRRRVLAAFELAERSTDPIEQRRLLTFVIVGGGPTGVELAGDAAHERIETHTVLWAAGVKPSALGAALGAPLDRAGRVMVAPDLSLPGHPEVWVAGDLAHCARGDQALPGNADVAKQQGHHRARQLERAARGLEREPFRYRDLGMMATIGRDRAIADFHRFALTGWLAWFGWALLHIYRLMGFRNRAVVMVQWAWSYWTNRRGARLILGASWRSYP